MMCKAYHKQHFVVMDALIYQSVAYYSLVLLDILERCFL